jgi:hypothetical protein
MQLLRPSPGECIDRQTILQIKIQEATKAGSDGRHFRDEDKELQLYLERTWFQAAQGEVVKRLELFSADLKKVNQSLWDLENKIRYLKSLPKEKRDKRTEDIVSIALAIPELNDERARLVGIINSLFGLMAQEKLYCSAPPETR